MKQHILMAGVVFVFGYSAHSQTVLADWTFESSGLGSTTPSYSPGAGLASTNFYAEAGTEAGTATAIGLHAAAASYTSPVGDGSAKSLSSANWAVNDYYQFELNTTGYSGLNLSFDQTSSGTGPSSFQVEYSLTGVSGSFVSLGTYTVLDNGLAPNATWNSTSVNSAYSYNFALSALTTGALDNQSLLFIRLVDSGTEDAAGTASVGSSGTDRIDNVVVSSVPEPVALFPLGLGAMGCLRYFRKDRRNSK